MLLKALKNFKKLLDDIKLYAFVASLIATFLTTKQRIDYDS